MNSIKLLSLSVIVSIVLFSCSNNGGTGGNCGTANITVDGNQLTITSIVGVGSRQMDSPPSKGVGISMMASDSSLILVQIYDYNNNTSDCFTNGTYYSISHPQADIFSMAPLKGKVFQVSYQPGGGGIPLTNISDTTGSLTVTSCGNGKISANFTTTTSGPHSISGTISNACYTIVN